jgi:hypothetical protein
MIRNMAARKKSLTLHILQLVENSFQVPSRGKISRARIIIYRTKKTLTKKGATLFGLVEKVRHNTLLGLGSFLLSQLHQSFIFPQIKEISVFIILFFSFSSIHDFRYIGFGTFYTPLLNSLLTRASHRPAIVTLTLPIHQSNMSNEETKESGSLHHHFATTFFEKVLF